MGSRFQQMVSAFEEHYWWYTCLSKVVIMFAVYFLFSRNPPKCFALSPLQLWSSGYRWCIGAGVRLLLWGMVKCRTGLAWSQTRIRQLFCFPQKMVTLQWRENKGCQQTSWFKWFLSPPVATRTLTSNSANHRPIKPWIYKYGSPFRSLYYSSLYSQGNTVRRYSLFTYYFYWTPMEGSWHEDYL